MATTKESLEAFLAEAGPTVLVEVESAKGSTPREAGARMLVSDAGIHGTIGGGQLEYMAIDKARQLLAGDPSRDAACAAHRVPVRLDIPLGPEIGQCCGGRVGVALNPVSPALKAELVRRADAEDAGMRHVYVFGGGHVGHALARALVLLPVKTVVVETRAGEIDGLPAGVGAVLTAVPEDVVRAAPANAAFVVLTHDHALDFLIVSEALKREDAAYVGMIGSKTKRATFRNWFVRSGGGREAEFSHLVCPIGGSAVRDKRPAVIAALAAAEIATALLSNAASVSAQAG